MNIVDLPCLLTFSSNSILLPPVFAPCTSIMVSTIVGVLASLYVPIFLLCLSVYLTILRNVYIGVTACHLSVLSLFKWLSSRSPLVFVAMMCTRRSGCMLHPRDYVTYYTHSLSTDVALFSDRHVWSIFHIRNNMGLFVSCYPPIAYHSLPYGLSSISP